MKAGLELAAFSMLDAMVSAVRNEVNAAICAEIHDRMNSVERAGLLRLLGSATRDGGRSSVSHSSSQFEGYLRSDLGSMYN
ncbi:MULTISPECIES: hypothetical protein [unclassified Streptomyces]|uniref:hypothetical protein n=1 Tax=unclassified Streptomyces TaxID=2593676 RepID=UPI00382E23BC